MDDRHVASLAHGFAMKYGLIANMTHAQAVELEDALRIYLTGALWGMGPLDEKRLARAIAAVTDGYMAQYAEDIAKAYREDT